MRKVIQVNEMNFMPTGNDPREDSCSTIWRVGMGGCWAQWTLVIFDWETGEVIDVITDWVQCDSSDCCFQEYKICRDDDDGIHATALGPPGIVDCSGKTFWWYPCEAKCHWLQSVEGYIGHDGGSGTQGKQSQFPEINESNSIGFNTKVESDGILFNIKYASGQRGKISLFDINGNLMKRKSFNISSNLYQEMIRTGELNSGVYLYSIEIDGFKLHSGKINIVK